MAETTYKKGELLFEGDITTIDGDDFIVGTLSLNEGLNQDFLLVSFDNIEYLSEKYVDGDEGNKYGGITETGNLDFLSCPFMIQSNNYGVQLYTEHAGTYSLKIYTAISDSDSSSEPVTIRSYIDKNLTNLNWNILPQIFESEGVELTEEIERYLRETPKNTNWNMMQTIIGSNEDGIEIWFSSDTYEDNGGGRTFLLLNPDYTEHITELLANAENYRIYVNNEELLNFRRITETQVGWTDGDSVENTTTSFMAMIDSHENIGALVGCVDSSVAPVSVEIAVKQK